MFAPSTATDGRIFPVPTSDRTEYRNELWHGDCLELLTHLPDASVDLIVTSPPYADNRKSTYGGVHADQYVEWFLPIGGETPTRSGR